MISTVPKFLYGTSRQVERQWSKVKNDIWIHSDWSAFEESEAMELPQDQPLKLIVAQHGEYRYKTSEILPYVIPENPFVDDVHERRKQWQNHATLTWRGLRYFWFALSLSSNSFNGCGFFEQIDRGEEFVYEDVAYRGASFYRKWFSLYLPWFDELASLSPYCLSVYDRGRVVLESPVDFITIWHVALKAELCNYIDLLIKNTPFSELVARLVSEGLVNKTVAGYQLR